MLFCDRNSCNNLLLPIIKNNELIFKCNICMEEYDSIPRDTLMSDVSLVENEFLFKFQTYLKNAASDTLVKYIKKDCNNSQCKETIVKVISIDQNGQSIYICPTCNNRFI